MGTTSADVLKSVLYRYRMEMINVCFHLLIFHFQRNLEFVISDINKERMDTVHIIVPGIPHFLCFRHLMENFK